MNSFLADELEKKVKYLSLALSNAASIISHLEAENKRLSDLLSAIAEDNESVEELGHA
jgi:hypothetical protein